jgi:NAD+ kinase
MPAALKYKTIGIFSRPRPTALAGVVPQLLAWLRDRGVTPLYDPETACAVEPCERCAQERSEIARRADMILVLGGDGTILAATREAAPRGIPILPINLGGLGFLTSFTLDELYPALEDALAGVEAVNERVLLCVERIHNGQKLAVQRVLNEAVVHKGSLARMIELELHIDGAFVCRYRSDGLIVATPTGSTAYSLSAAGPIVHPAVEATLITPICPHTLSDRPVVVPDSSRIELRFSEHTSEVVLTLDGQIGVQLEKGDRVAITRAAQRLKLIHPANKTYFEILRSKLKWGEA